MHAGMGHGSRVAGPGFARPSRHAAFAASLGLRIWSRSLPAVGISLPRREAPIQHRLQLIRFQPEQLPQPLSLERRKFREGAPAPVNGFRPPLLLAAATTRSKRRLLAHSDIGSAPRLQW